MQMDKCIWSKMWAVHVPSTLVLKDAERLASRWRLQTTWVMTVARITFLNMNPHAKLTNNKLTWDDGRNKIKKASDLLLILFTVRNHSLVFLLKSQRNIQSCEDDHIPF